MIRKEDLDTIYLIDFGMSTSYWVKKKKEQGHHMNQNFDAGFGGTLEYASMRQIHEIQPSRRDDLETIGLILVRAMNGSLPWMGLPDNPEKRQKIS